MVLSLPWIESQIYNKKQLVASFLDILDIFSLNISLCYIISNLLKMFATCLSVH